MMRLDDATQSRVLDAVQSNDIELIRFVDADGVYYVLHSRQERLNERLVVESAESIARAEHPAGRRGDVNRVVADVDVIRGRRAERLHYDREAACALCPGGKLFGVGALVLTSAEDAGRAQGLDHLVLVASRWRECSSVCDEAQSLAQCVGKQHPWLLPCNDGQRLYCHERLNCALECSGV